MTPTINWTDVPEAMPPEQLEMLIEARIKGLLFDGAFFGAPGPSFLDAHRIEDLSISYTGPTGARTTIVVQPGALTTLKHA